MVGIFILHLINVNRHGVQCRRIAEIERSLFRNIFKFLVPALLAVQYTFDKMNFIIHIDVGSQLHQKPVLNHDFDVQHIGNIIIGDVVKIIVLQFLLHGLQRLNLRNQIRIQVARFPHITSGTVCLSGNSHDLWYPFRQRQNTGFQNLTGSGKYCKTFVGINCT